MKIINLREFRANSLHYLEKAHNGEELAVTSHGKILATIQPPTDKREKANFRLMKRLLIL